MAVSKGFPKYIDGSCRREPDFENRFPAITGLCRPGFAEKLRKDDIVIYATNKKGIGSRRVVAVLEVIDECEDHLTASRWYKSRRRIIPNNIMVNETKRFDLEETHQMGPWDSWIERKDGIEEWDKGYKERARDYPEVAVCRSLFINLNDPPELTERQMQHIFGRRPGTRNPSLVKPGEWKELKKIIGMRTSQVITT